MNILRKLQDPYLVMQFQSFFGIHIINQGKLEHDITAYKNENSEKIQKIKSLNTSEDKNTSELWSFFFADDMVGGGGGTVKRHDNESEKLHVIKNWFWYYLFFAATKTGDEVFYTAFFPFWKWNIDGAVIRKVIYIWMITMYIGQALKDILKVPRPPCPPVVRLDTKWGLEYGLPSTHAMVAFSIPFSILSLSLSRYQLNFNLCFTIAFVWCTLVCASRIYLGMHSILDIVSGLILISGLLVLILPLVDAWDRFMLIHPFSPLIAVTLCLAMLVCYPTTDRWTPARGDTTVIVGVGCGILLGSWLNYQLGLISETDLNPPFTILWPSGLMIGLSILRTLLGLVLLLAVRATFKSLSMTAICTLLQVSTSDYMTQPSKISPRQRLIVEHVYKFITYLCIGFTIVFTVPLIFKKIGIDRPTFYTEM